MLGAALGLSGWRAADALPPEPRSGELSLATSPFVVNRKPGEEARVLPEQWLRIVGLYGDFDLQCEVELGDGAELDLAVRHVEPRIRGGERLPFSSRFAVLRLSTLAAGRPWLTREEALFGAPSGGVPLEAGAPATVWVKARGTTLTANVAGRVLEPFEVVDDHGDLVLVARGAPCLLRSLRIDPVGRTEVPRPFAACILTGLVLGWVSARRRVGWFRLGFAAASALGTSELVRALVFGAVPPHVTPAATVLWTVALAGAPLAAAAVWFGRRWYAVWSLAAVAALLATAWPASLDASRLRLREPALVDAVFGPAAGAAPLEALAGMLRGPFELHPARTVAPRVAVLGGTLALTGGTLRDEDHLEPLLQGALRAAGNKDVEVVSLPTVDGWLPQQWTMFRRFHADQPLVALVLVAGPDEAAMVRGSAQWWAAQQAVLENVGGFGLPLDTMSCMEPVPWAATEAPRSDPRSVRDTVAAAAAWCRQRGTVLVLTAAAGTPEPVVAELRAAAADGVVWLPPPRAGAIDAGALAAALQPAMR
ncbi:MAG: hypothetical protein RL148_2403 [Planctomycetota bacterium]